MPVGPRRQKILFNPQEVEPFRLSRSKIELFRRCPLCFYLDRRLGISLPPTPPYNLNIAVDHLLKKEFDLHRAKNTVHPLLKSYRLNALPFRHRDLDKWRDNFRGIEYYHQPTNLIITGAPDDLWINSRGELLVVDYKATSKSEEVTLDAPWQRSYKNQLEIYQWLFRRNGFLVAKTGYFVYVNGRRDKEAFDGKLEFDIKLIPYLGDDSWIEPALFEIKQCLLADSPPRADSQCSYCCYRQTVNRTLKK